MDDFCNYNSPGPRAAARRSVPRNGGCAGAKRSYPTLKVSNGGGKEITLIQSKEQGLCFPGAAVKRYPTPKVRETQVRW